MYVSGGCNNSQQLFIAILNSNKCMNINYLIKIKGYIRFIASHVKWPPMHENTDYIWSQVKSVEDGKTDRNVIKRIIPLK